MAAEDWNWRYPVELQDVPWDCAAASLTWALNAWGYAITEAEVVKGLGPGRISPALGLLDATGAGLVSYLEELGVPASYNPAASWQDVADAAGYQPMVMGGREWCHWTGVRMGAACFGSALWDYLLIANPAPGWMGVGQYMTNDVFAELGPFSAVWFPV